MYKKPNHLRASGSWRGVKNNGAPNWKPRANCTEKEILSTVPSEEESDSSSQSPKVLLRQLAVEINADSKNIGRDSSPEEKSSSEPFSDPSLEWDQENLVFKADTTSSSVKDDDENLEMKHLNKETPMTVLEEMAEEDEHDECDKLLTEQSSSEHGSSDSHSLDSDTPVLTYKTSIDFSRHLYLTCGQDEVDNPNPFLNGTLEDISENPNKDNLVGIEENEDALTRFYDDVENTSRRLYEDVDQLGFTEFDTMNDISSRSPFVSSPTPSSLHKSPLQSIPTSPIASTHGSSRSGFSELPFRNSLTDTLRLSEPDSPYGSPREIQSGYTPGFLRDNRKISTGSSTNSGRLLLQEKPDSPRNKFRPGIFSEFRSGDSPGGSLKDGLAEKRKQKGGLRRALTEFNCPSDSCGSLNEKPMTPSRRRKISAAIQPPTIFAPLVTNVNNPYKDFVPPLRESEITCDCESADNIPGMSCNNCLERKSDDLDSINEIDSDDQNEDFYKNMENLFAESQLQCSNISGSDHCFEEVEEYSSKLTATSETSFEDHEQRSDPSQKINDSSIDCSSVQELDDYIKYPFTSHSGLQRPSISGAYSTHCIGKDEIPESDELGQLFRPMRTSFSEPHLNLRLPVLPGSNGSTHQGLSRLEDEGSFLSEDTTTRNLEDIFKDVSSTREAIEKLEMILKSPEPEILTDLADTKQTVQNLDRQVLNLNREVASLSNDVRSILELLRGLKSGQVVV